MPSLPKTLEELFDHIDNNTVRYIENLRTACAIKSVSTWADHRPEIQKMVDWTAQKLRDLGTTVETADVGIQTFPDGSQIPLPKVILGTLGNDKTKKTVLVYGHLDVQPAAKSDGWDTEPFELIEKDGKLYARGSTDDKGPVLCWLHAIEAYQALDIPLPVNIKFVLEGMEECGSEGLDDLLVEVQDTFLKGVDYVCISDNYWLGKEKPCLTYGLRGLCYFYLEVECASKDLHSGLFGGSIHEAMTDLIYLLDTLIDKDGQILVTDIYKDVTPLADNEQELYENIEFDVQEFKNDVGAAKLMHNDEKTKILMHRWRYPSLSIHGIEGAFAEQGQKTVIPRKVIGKFSIRIVPNQKPEDVGELVKTYLTEKFAERGSPNTMNICMVNSGKTWSEDPNHPNYQAARQAVRHVFNTSPDMTREGGSIPVTITLQETTGKNTILIPVGAADDGAHSQNEKINVSNYVQGTKLLGAYLYEIAQLD